jgi:hypothetical protein
MNDIKEYKSSSKILFLNGVFLNDCVPIDEIFEQQLMDQIEIDRPVLKYDKMPSIFTNIDDWCEKVNIQCWNCNLMFDNKPVFMPTYIEHINGFDYSIGIEGCFCTFTCASHFIDIVYKKIYDNINRKNMLSLLWKIFHKSNHMIKFFNIPPSKYDMIHYGGNKEIKDFKLELKQLDDSTKMNI